MSSDRARAVHEAPHGRAPSAKRIAVVEPARAEDRKVIREILRGPRGRAHPKLVAGTPDDPLEREADDLADAVMRRPMGAADAPLLESHRIEAVSGAPRGSDPVGRAVSPTARPAAPAAILRQGPSEPDPRWPPLGGGTVLAEDLRAEFEPRFGTSLGHVRIHTDSESAHLARDLGARAFTVGSDIGFAQGELAPWSHRGRALMAHELAHVVLGHHGINRKEGSNDSEGSTTKAGSVALAVANPPLALAIAEVELLGGALKGIWTGFASRLDADDHEQLVELLQGLPEHAPSFLAGVQIGQVMGLGEGLLNNLKFILYEIPAGVWHAVGKLSPGERLGLFAAFVSPIPGATAMALATIAAKELREHREGLAAFAKVIYEEIRTLVTDLEGQGDWLEELGKRVGEPLGRELGDTFRGEILYEPDYYWKGGMLGRISGLIAFEILLLVVAPEALLGKVGAATLPLVRRLAKALEGTKLWRRVEGLVAKSKALEQVASLRKAGGVVEEVAGTGKAAHAVGDAEKAVGQSVEAGKAVEGAVGTKAALGESGEIGKAVDTGTGGAAAKPLEPGAGTGKALPAAEEGVRKVGYERVTPEAQAWLAKHGFSGKAMKSLGAARDDVVEAFNLLHDVPGFEHVAADWFKSGSFQEGARFVLRWVRQEVVTDPTIKARLLFELKRGVSSGAAEARRVDVWLGGRCVELKSWTLDTFNASTKRLRWQFIKDIALSSSDPKKVLWVFDGAKIGLSQEKLIGQIASILEADKSFISMYPRLPEWMHELPNIVKIANVRP